MHVFWADPLCFCFMLYQNPSVASLQVDLSFCISINPLSSSFNQPLECPNFLQPIPFKIEYVRAIVWPLKRDIEMCGVRANFVNRARLKFFKFLSLIKTTGVAQTRAAVIEMLAKSKCDCVSLASCYVLSTRSDKEHSPGIATE